MSKFKKVMNMLMCMCI